MKHVVTVGKQQLLRDQHKHRARRLRVVRRAQRILVQVGQHVREEQSQLPSRILVAEAPGAPGNGYPDIQVMKACCYRFVRTVRLDFVE
jgi:hypothetical protein